METLKEKLATMTDSELIASYEQMLLDEEAEYAMDGSGECGAYIAEAFYDTHVAYITELDKREITFETEEETSFPY